MQLSVVQMLREGLARLGKAIGAHEIKIDQLPEEAANRLRRDQIRGAIKEMRLFLGGTTVFAPVISMQAWGIGINWLAILYTLMMWGFSWWLIYRWFKTYQTDGSKKDMDSFVAETRVNAGLYCLGMVFFYPFVSGNEKTIICCIMVGSLALGTVGFSHAPRAAFWYLGFHAVTITLVPLLYGLYWNSTPDLLLSALAFVAGVAIFNACLQSARDQMRAFVNHEALKQKSEVIDLLLKDYEEQGVELMWSTDAEGKMTNCPHQIKELIGDPKRLESSATMVDILSASIDPQGTDDLAKVASAFAEQVDFHNVTLPVYSKDTNALKWIMMRGRPQLEGTKFVGFRGIFADATTAVEAQKRVEFLAQNDPLTETCNRNHIQTKLEALDPLQDKATGYLIDLDGFKQVNDSYGHAVGDQLLQQVADRIKEIVDDATMIARLGGDEFLVLTDDSKRFETRLPRALAERLLTRLSEPYIIGRFDILISASVGSATFPNDTTEGASLLNLADLALYAAKKGGRNKYVRFIESMQTGLQKRKIITDRLRLALNENLITPHYQPQHCAQSKKLIGFEALARWTDAELGAVGPDIFIPIAEETGLIQQVGEHILRTACQDALTWDVPAGEEPLTVSVNLSPVQVRRRNVVTMVHNILEETGLPPERLEIEVTESVLIEDTEGTRQTLANLQKLGVRIALDDFGTGYSSLSYLRALPLHRVKIDRSFIADIDDFEAQSIVQTIIELCARLKLDVVAEGVETLQSAKTLSEMNCGVLQGYYFSPPVPAKDTQPLIEKYLSSAA